ncbi:bifunctional metallophosphatase/5'-nucleotidase [Paracoccus gahaiensis]|uniref:Bifunctional metallophosphatase/5'-nucleotidase n=1 Tax=Paracoccus gahaiensis TaxID=1706839 RepID=A0A4V5MVU2_9RHOB|nr:5'-nucleotidase C-terminal domain-containing protein [Paracoccus gahaiensis]TJZ89908.1 bifunctional metallophosphatase/5'-nucleotidase [Paracoccus gahaiensis]
MPDVTLFQLNDSHGYLEPHPELHWTPDGPALTIMGGFARIAGVLNAARTTAPGSVLAFDNGDTFHGTPTLTLSEGEAAVPILNALGLSAMTGHWDFAYGPTQTARLAGMLNYPFLAANCHALIDKGLPFPATTVCRAGGLSVGVIGLAATILDKTMPPSFSTGLRFTDGIEETRAHAARLRAQGCDLIVVLSHLGLPQDRALATAVDGLDVILSGHTHNRLDRPWIVNNTILIQSGCHASFLGRLDLTVERGRIIRHDHQLIPINLDLPEEADVAEMVTQAVAPVAGMRRFIVGQTDQILHRATCLDAPMDDVLLAAIAQAADTQIAFSNGWRYGAPIPAGPVTLHDLWCIIPTTPPIETVELSGSEIIAMMEENLEATFACDPFGQRGGYVKRFCGLDFSVKLENPSSHRIEQAFGPNGQPLALQSRYRVAFVTLQAVPSKYGTDRRNTGVTAVAALLAWFGVKAPVRPGRIRIV